jgi:hypothetical protein
VSLFILSVDCFSSLGDDDVRLRSLCDIALPCVLICRHVAAQKKNCTCYKRFVGVTSRLVTQNLR